ncbi:MAG: CysB family HTH-type transcriptional regulator [Betaproteobacteria bacterium]|nr:CysB family HTH-type transcriptional regulator [Betaproteobacteria bacterium]
MNLQQLRYVRETIRAGLSLTTAAERLHTSQPGISRQIRQLEDELGIDFFVRRGKRVTALTEAGRALAQIVERVLEETENLRRAAAEFHDQEAGALTIAVTHTQARYALPGVVAEFKRRYPRVHLSLLQGNPPQVAEMTLAGTADVGIATEALANYPRLLALPGYTWQHALIVPAAHPLSVERRVSLEALARYPLITYDSAFAGRTHIDEAFAARGLKPDIVLAAIDSDVIKTYVELGLGVGIIAAMAFDSRRDGDLRMLDASHLFRTNTTRIALLRGRRLRQFTYAFIELFAPSLSRALVEKAMAGSRDSYEL